MKRQPATLWLVVIAGNILGLIGVFYLLPVAPLPFTRLHVFVAAFALITTSLVAGAFIRFLDGGWQVRFDEIRNNLSDGKLRAYLGKFWHLRVETLVGATANIDTAEQLTEVQLGKLFGEIYREQYGRRAFFIPLLLLLSTVFIEAVLAVLTRRGVLTLGGMSDGNLQIALASIAGGYMFVVGDSIANVRRRSLNIADVYSYALRMVLAVPIGLSISLAAAPALGALVAFGMSSLPLDEINKIIRSLTYQKLALKDPAQDTDQLVQLEGVTAAISATLGAEGVSSVDQLLSMDPVLLTIRTGLPFDLLLRLAAQAITGRYLTGAVASQLPIGLGDASTIAALVTRLDSADPAIRAPAATVLLDCAAKLRGPPPATSPTNESVEFQFRRIAADSYTRFLGNP